MAFKKARDVNEARQNNEVMKIFHDKFYLEVAHAIFRYENFEESEIKPQVKRPNNIGAGVFEKSEHAKSLMQELKTAGYQNICFRGEKNIEGTEHFVTLQFTE